MFPVSSFQIYLFFSIFCTNTSAIKHQPPHHDANPHFHLFSSPSCSYCSLIDIADHLFPPIRENEEDMSKYDEYSNFNFWRDPVCDIPIDDLLLNTSSSVTATKSSSPKAKKESKGDKGGGASSNNTSLTTIPEK